MKNYNHPLFSYMLKEGIKVKDMANQIPIDVAALRNILDYHYIPALQTAVRIYEITKGQITPIDLYNAFYEANPHLKKGVRTRQVGD